MRIKVNPEEKSLTGDKMKGGGGTENRDVWVHKCAALWRLL